MDSDVTDDEKRVKTAGDVIGGSKNCTYKFEFSPFPVHCLVPGIPILKFGTRMLIILWNPENRIDYTEYKKE